MISKTILALGTLCSAATANTGVHASLDIAIVEQAKDIYMDVILKAINNLALPNIGDSKDYLHGNHVSVSQNAQNVIFDVDVANNAVKLTCKDLSANFYSDSFRAHSWIFVAKGNLEVKMSTVGIGLGLSFTTQTLPDGRVMPAVDAVDVLVDIDRNDIDIKIWGNIWADFAAAFEIFFKSTVVGLIQDGVETALSTTVPAVINAAFAGTDGMFAIPTENNWFLDWEMPIAAIVTETALEVGAKGIMFDEQVGESEWSSAFVDMPYKDSTETAGFQAYLSDLSVDSLMGSWLEVGDIAGWEYGDQLPEKFNTTITAGLLNTALPGMTAKYGADTIVDILGNCTALHSFASSAANQDVSVQGTVNLQFWPRLADGSSELAVEFEMIDILFTGGIDVLNFNATANISTFLVDKVNVISSTIGNLSAFKLKVEFNTVSKLLVPSLNNFIQKYAFPIPQNILGIFTLNGLFLEYADGYIFAGATPTFLPPTPTEVESIAEPLHFEQF